MRELPGKRVVLRPLSEPTPPSSARSARRPRSPRGGVHSGTIPLSDDPDATRFTIVCGEEIAGLIQYGEELEPDYRYAWIDIFVDPPRQRRGVGTDAIATLVRYLIEERGHHRVTIDPAADNEAAIGCYRTPAFGVSASWRRRGATPPPSGGATPS